MNNSIQKRSRDAGIDALAGIEAEEYYSDEYYGVAQPRVEKRQLLSILSTFRKHWLLIVGLTILGTCLVIVYEARKPDYYTAEVRIQVNNEANPAAGGSSTGSIILNQGNDPGYFTTQLQILEGPGLLRRVVKTLDLEHNTTFFRPGAGQENSVWQNIQRMFGMYDPSRAKAESKPKPPADNTLNLKIDSTTDLDSQAEVLAPYVGYIRSSLAVSPVRDNRTMNRETRLIKVEYTHHDPALATKVVNTVADIYVLQNLEQKVQSNASASDFLQKRVAELQAQIRSGEERLINYAKSNQILSLDASQNTVIQRLADLNTKLSQAENERISAEAAYRAAMQNPMSGTIAESKDARTTNLEGQLTDLRKQLALMKVEFTDEWPEVQKVQRQINAIELELQSSRKRSSATQAATLEQTFKEAASKESALRSSFEAQRATVLNQNEAAINYRIIQQEIDTNKALLSNLLQRSRETEVVLNRTPNNVHVADRALVPNSPAGPQRTKNVLLAFVASLLAGLGLAFALSWLDDTIRAADDFEAQLGLPVLGLIPKAVSDGFGARLLPARFNRNGNKRIGKYSYDLENFEKPMITEAFHQFRTSLLLSTAGGAPKTILVTSGQPFEGKTVTSLNLAKSLAQLGGKVLLIDADLRCPKMHVVNEVKNSHGLSTLLTAKEVTQEMIDEAVQADVESNLDVLPSGPRVPNPANLFSSVEMDLLLRRLGVTYSYIIIDSPPLLYFADSVILSSIVDSVVLIARANYSSRNVLARARKKITDVRANVVGLVINDLPAESFGYYNNTYYRELEAAEAQDATSSVLHLN